MADVADRRVGDRIARCKASGWLVIATVRHRFGKELGETALDVLEIDSIFRLLRARYARTYRREIELDDLRVIDLAFFWNPVHALRFEIRLDRIDVLFAAGHPVILERLIVDCKEAAGRTVIGRHVGDRGAIGR